MVRKICLDGEWDFIADLDPKYHSDTNIYPNPPYAQLDLNRRHWQKVTVPGVWQKYGVRYEIYEGVCWFAREFCLSDIEHVKNARLRFGAVNYSCRIFLNGIELGSHETGYTEFTVKATSALRDGYNLLSVMVDNRATTTKWPPCLGYFNYGGIHRSVTLELAESVFLDEVVLLGHYNDEKCILDVSGKIINPNNENAQSLLTEYYVEVTCNNVEHIFLVQENGFFKGSITIPDAEKWSPTQPILYDVIVRLLRDKKIIDINEFKCGFRTITTESGKIHLNGEPLFLKGICYVYDSPTTGLVMRRDQIRTDINLIKEMGCNSIRCHYPMDAMFYEECDKQGILVWIEPTIYCYHPNDNERGTCFTDPNCSNLSLQMSLEMISVAINHPCVIIYGIGNECNSHHVEAKDFFVALAEYIRSIDSSRLISYAALYGLVGPIEKIVDVLGVNSYWGWYDKIFGGKGLSPDDSNSIEGSVSNKEDIDLSAMVKMINKIIHDSDDDLILLLTEFGADSVPGFYARGLDLWSENYHAELFRRIFNLVDNYPQIAGTFPFCYSDYRDPSKVSNGYWNELNLKGVVSYERRKKLPFYALKDIYNKFSER